MPFTVALAGPPGSGKTSISALCYGRLKQRRVDVEWVTELAKQYVYENPGAFAQDGFDISLALQQQRLEELFRRQKTLEVLIVEAPLFNPYLYALHYGKHLEIPVLEKIAREWALRYDRILLTRFPKGGFRYNTFGRNESEKQARVLEGHIEHHLRLLYGPAAFAERVRPIDCFTRIEKILPWLTPPVTRKPR